MVADIPLLSECMKLICLVERDGTLINVRDSERTIIEDSPDRCGVATLSDVSMFLTYMVLFLRLNSCLGMARSFLLLLQIQLFSGSWDPLAIRINSLEHSRCTKTQSHA